MESKCELVKVSIAEAADGIAWLLLNRHEHMWLAAKFAAILTERFARMDDVSDDELVDTILAWGVRYLYNHTNGSVHFPHHSLFAFIAVASRRYVLTLDGLGRVLSDTWSLRFSLTQRALGADSELIVRVGGAISEALDQIGMHELASDVSLSTESMLVLEAS